MRRTVITGCARCRPRPDPRSPPAAATLTAPRRSGADQVVDRKRRRLPRCQPPHGGSRFSPPPTRFTHGLHCARAAPPPLPHHHHHQRRRDSRPTPPPRPSPNKQQPLPTLLPVQPHASGPATDGSPPKHRPAARWFPPLGAPERRDASAGGRRRWPSSTSLSSSLSSLLSCGVVVAEVVVVVTVAATARRSVGRRRDAVAPAARAAARGRPRRRRRRRRPGGGHGAGACAPRDVAGGRRGCVAARGGRGAA